MERAPLAREDRIRRSDDIRLRDFRIPYESKRLCVKCFVLCMKCLVTGFAGRGWTGRRRGWEW